MGVRVVTNQHGYLRFRIFWKGQDIAVSTLYRDDGPQGRNRRLVNAKALLIEENLRHGAELHRALLEVLGDCPPRLMPTPSPAPKLRTLRSYYGEWIERKVLLSFDCQRRSGIGVASRRSCCRNWELPSFKR